MNLGEEGKFREKGANITNGIPKLFHEFIQIGHRESVKKWRVGGDFREGGEYR